MIKASDIFNLLKENNINCFCGVPDSLLKDFCAYVTDNTSSLEHTITANEGNAIAMAAGHFLATGHSALVYMQNSGLGNCVNPLLSLTDEEVYNIPVLMFIGWRGEPNTKDEPQHIKQGKVTDKLLDAMGIKYTIMPDEFDKAKPLIEKALDYMRETNCPYAFIIRKNTFEKYKGTNKKKNLYSLVREEAIEKIIKNLVTTDIVVATTGHISREVYEIRNRLKQPHERDFLTVGSMGHASSIASGIALSKKNRCIYCFDGDGAFLMHLGAVCVNASKKLKNFKHIVFNNEAHDSVGAQPTVADGINIAKIALDCGYKKAYSAATEEELLNILPKFSKASGPILLEVKVKCGAREDLGRPKEKPCENKKIFVNNLKQTKFCYQGAIENLSEILKSEKAKNILVLTGKKSYEAIKPQIEKELNGCHWTYYNDFSTNPQKEEIEKALKKIKQNYDIMIAIGGGSVIDFAKGYRYYGQKQTKLIAIPTTAGTGSEATQFAVIYINGIKNSLDDETILPEYAILDSYYVENNPQYLKACTAMDAFCQAIESYWAVKSTPLSREYAKQAMTLCKENIVDYVLSANKQTAEKMMLAANLAGKAINISRTTAAHALSYKLTIDYHIPHGHAVALSMAGLFRANGTINENSCNDSRGYKFVQERMSEILNILQEKDFMNYWQSLMKKIGLEYDLRKLGIEGMDFVNAVNIERLKNNPKQLKHHELLNLFKINS